MLAVLVDPAWEANKIEQAVLPANVKVVGILITHYHPDHINLANYEVPVPLLNTACVLTKVNYFSLSNHH
jgi:glyoxylase-like metal-dependent hydrolase (beta-lactamase superfamily II)